MLLHFYFISHYKYIFSRILNLLYLKQSLNFISFPTIGVNLKICSNMKYLIYYSVMAFMKKKWYYMNYHIVENCRYRYQVVACRAQAFLCFCCVSYVTKCHIRIADNNVSEAIAQLLYQHTYEMRNDPNCHKGNRVDGQMCAEYNVLLSVHLFQTKISFTVIYNIIYAIMTNFIHTNKSVYIAR